MYFQKRFDKENPDQSLEEMILQLREIHKDYGYRCMCAELRNQGYIVNKKKVQRIMQKLQIQVRTYTKKVVNTGLAEKRLGQ